MALLLTESHERFFEDPNFSLIMRSASTALAQREFQLLLILADTAVEQRRAVDFMTAGHVDGALLVSGHRDRLDFLEDLLAAEVPLIAVGAPLGFETRVAYVQAEDVEGARTMTRYLRESGRRRIAHVAGPQDTPGHGPPRRVPHGAGGGLRRLARGGGGLLAGERGRGR